MVLLQVVVISGTYSGISREVVEVGIVGAVVVRSVIFRFSSSTLLLTVSLLLFGLASTKLELDSNRYLLC